MSFNFESIRLVIKNQKQQVKSNQLSIEMLCSHITFDDFKILASWRSPTLSGISVIVTLMNTSSVGDCEKACAATKDCNFLTFTNFRNIATCHLLSQCEEKVGLVIRMNLNGRIGNHIFVHRPPGKIGWAISNFWEKQCFSLFWASEFCLASGTTFFFVGGGLYI